VKQNLPHDAVLVGQCIQHDIDWIGLKKGVDFRDSFDISHIFRQRIPKNLKKIVESINDRSVTIPGIAPSEGIVKDDADTLSTSSAGSCTADGSDNDEIPTRYRVFSLRHCCLHLLAVDIQTSTHDPVTDAKYSIILFNEYKDQSVMMIRCSRDALHRAPNTLSFAKQTPILDGVCLSKDSYRFKYAGRVIWLWWSGLFGGHLIPKLKQTK